MVEYHWPRPDFVEDMSPADQTVMDRHVDYVARLAQDGLVIVAGSTQDEPIGMVFLREESEGSARAAMDADPIIAAGVLRGRLRPFFAGFVGGGEPYDFRRHGAETKEKEPVPA